MKRLLASLLGLALYSVAPGVLAADPTVPVGPQESEPSAQHKRYWYGWQTLASDAASALLLFGAFPAAGRGGLFSSNTPAVANAMAVLGVAGYAAGAPTLHFIHERPLEAMGSVALRLTLPAAGAVVASQLVECPKPGFEYGNCQVVPIWGIGVGTLAAIVIDATLLAWEPKAPRRRQDSESSVATLGFAPVLSSDGKRGELQIFGSF